MYDYLFAGENILAPVSGTFAVDLAAGNNKTISLASATEAIILNLVTPFGVCYDGVILIRQHVTVSKDITKFQRNGVDEDVKWLGTEPDWGADAPNTARLLYLKDEGTQTFLWATGVSA